MQTSFQNDIDFIKFWKSICQFFAYYVVLARKYGTFYRDHKTLLEYLRQRDLLICDDETLENLNFLMRRYYDEIRKRGTIQIIKQRTIYDLDDSQSESGYADNLNEIDGELLRLICFDKCDDFIFNFRKVEKLGWNINNSSPLYKGTSNMEGCNKIWSLLLTATDYLKYPLFGTSFISSIQENDESMSDSNSDALINPNYVIQIANPVSPDYAGIGLDNTGADPAMNKPINVDPNIDYEFNFRIKGSQVFNAAMGPVQFLSVGINAFDCDGVKQNLLSVIDNAVSIIFISNGKMNLSNKYFFFRGVIYSKNKFPEHDSDVIYKKDFIVSDTGMMGLSYYICIKQTIAGILITNVTYWRLLTQTELYSLLTCNNWAASNNLKFTSGVKKIVPYIKISNFYNNNNVVYLANIRFQPVATNYSTSFLDTNNWIDLFLKNNNKTYKYRELKEQMRHKLLPYNTEFEYNKMEVDILTE